MIKPFRQHTNREGNILFEFENIPFSNKSFLERFEIPWMTYLEFDPFTDKIIKVECSCPDFNINRGKLSDCKHIKEAREVLTKWNLN